MTIDTILWRRLDCPGHDACRLQQVDCGWRLNGAAAFLHKGVPACLAYQVTCDVDWLTREGGVQGWVGKNPCEFRVARTADGAWTLNNAAVSHLEGCVDLDLGFTPATNLFHMRRAALQVGQAAAIPVAWLDVFTGTLDVLQQRYERRTEESYWYEAPRFGYAALLKVRPVGFIEQYPGLWDAEP